MRYTYIIPGIENWNQDHPETCSEIVFQEQSYSSLHSGRSLAWDYFRGDIDNPGGIIADFCGVIADPCGVNADPCSVIADPFGVVVIDAAMPFVARLTKLRKTLLIKVKHHEIL